MKTKKIGEILRERREAHRLSVEQLARLTRIKPEYIAQIENNEFAGLPPSVYVKGYVRSLAEVFGVEPEPLLALLRRDYKETPQGSLLPQLALTKRRVSVWGGPIKWPALLAGALLLTIFGYLTLQWLLAQRPPALKVTDLTKLDVIAPDTVLTGVTDPEAMLLINDQPVALRPDGSFRYQLQLEQTGLVTLRFEARDQKGKRTIVERTVRVQPAPTPSPKGQ